MTYIPEYYIRRDRGHPVAYGIPTAYNAMKEHIECDALYETNDGRSPIEIIEKDESVFLVCVRCDNEDDYAKIILEVADDTNEYQAKT